jgi:hypothetical protein
VQNTAGGGISKNTDHSGVATAATLDLTTSRRLVSKKASCSASIVAYDDKAPLGPGLFGRSTQILRDLSQNFTRSPMKSGCFA